jgi:uncharacterized protein YggE
MIRAIAAAWAGTALLASAAAAQTPARDPGRFVIDAVGEATAAPDLATVRVGVRAESDSAVEAMAEQREDMNAVISALRAAGVAEQDIQTSGLSLYARYSAQDRSGVSSISGYEAYNQVSAVVRDLSILGATLDALVEAGANDIQGIELGVEAADELADAARRDAVAKMAHRAELYADATGLRLGRLVELRESSGFVPVERIVTTGARIGGADATPIAGGQLTVTVSVTGVYEIGG